MDMQKTEIVIQQCLHIQMQFEFLLLVAMFTQILICIVDKQFIFELVFIDLINKFVLKYFTNVNKRNTATSEKLLFNELESSYDSSNFFTRTPYIIQIYLIESILAL